MWRFVEQPICALLSILIRKGTDEVFVVHSVKRSIHHGLLYQLYRIRNSHSADMTVAWYMTTNNIKDLFVNIRDLSDRQMKRVRKQIWKRHGVDIANFL